MSQETRDVREDMTIAEIDPETLRDRLTEYVSSRLGTRVRIDGISRPDQSGMSSVSVLFAASWQEAGHDQQVDLVARLAPQATEVPVFPGYDLTQQYELMAGVAQRSAVPVPRVRWVEETPQALGQPFLIMDRLRGRVPADNPPYVFDGFPHELDEAQRRRLQDASVDMLAGIHAIAEPQEAFPTLASDAGLAAHFDSERRYYEWTRAEDGLRIPVLDDAFAWCEANWPTEPSPDVLCWGDARIGNIVYDGPEPVGVLDWESAWLAPRELDLGWFLFFHHMFQGLAELFEMPGLPGMFRRRDVVERYQQAAGVELADLDFYLTYAALRHGIVMSRIHRRRIRFGEVEAPADPDEYVLHAQMLRDLINGTYDWEAR